MCGNRAKSPRGVLVSTPARSFLECYIPPLVCTRFSMRSLQVNSGAWWWATRALTIYATFLYSRPPAGCACQDQPSPWLWAWPVPLPSCRGCLCAVALRPASGGLLLHHGRPCSRAPRRLSSPPREYWQLLRHTCSPHTLSQLHFGRSPICS